MTLIITARTMGPATKWLTPGRLLTPFGWAVQRVAEMAQVDAALLVHLLELDAKRMHLIALLLANCDGMPSQQLIKLLACSSAREVLNHALANRPAGLLRALDRLPLSEVLSPEGYRQLVELLGEPNAAQVLHLAPTIDENDIMDLHALPAHLRRRPVLDALSWLDDTRGLVDALHLFADRGAAPSFEAVVDQFALVPQTRHQTTAFS